MVILCTFGVEVEKTMENHLVDPTEKAENADLSENVTAPNSEFQHFQQILIFSGKILENLRLRIKLIVCR